MSDYLLIGKTQASLASLNDDTKVDAFVSNEDYPELKLRNGTMHRSVWVNVSMKAAIFNKCDFSYSSFINCYFRGARFDECDFTGCRFLDCNFSSSSMSGCRIPYTRWEKTELQRSTILGNLPSEANLAQKVLIQLRLNATSIGEYDDARYYLYEAEKRSRSHYLEILKCRQDYYRTKYSSIDRVVAPLRFLRSLSNQVLWGYGERPLLLSFWGLILIVVFGLIHASGDDAIGWWAGIQLSLGAFVTVLPVTTQSESSLGIWRLLESMLGIAYIAFLAASLHRRVSTRRD